MRLKLLAKFALRDLVYDRKVSFFVIAALVAVIAPLLLLFSLKYGVVSQLQNQLLNDPQNLEIKINGMQSNKVLDKAWFTRLQQHDSVQFVIPLTRSLNMQGDLRKDNQRFLNNVELIPTEKGDPLIPPELSLPDKTSVILTALSAEKLQVKTGETVTLFFGRKLDGNEEREKIELTVAGVLDERYFQRVGAFISLELLIEIEDYRDGFQITKFVSAPTTGKPITQPRDTFAKARIYAKQLDDVAPLALALREEGIDTQTQANAIENVKAIDRVLGTIFTIVATTSIIGCMLSLSGSFLANIERKRKDISLLSLFGVERHEIKIYVVIQAIALATLSFVFACLFFLCGSLAINHVLGANLAQNSFISLLQPWHFMTAFAFTLILSVLVALFGGQQTTKIQPAESLREN